MLKKNKVLTPDEINIINAKERAIFKREQMTENKEKIAIKGALTHAWKHDRENMGLVAIKIKSPDPKYYQALIGQCIIELIDSRIIDETEWNEFLEKSNPKNM